MKLLYEKTSDEDIEEIYELCKQLIHDYEQLDTINYPKVMNWVRKKIEKSIDEYITVYAGDRKAGYYHFYKNDSGQFEIDDLYVFPEFQKSRDWFYNSKKMLCIHKCANYALCFHQE